MRFFVLLCLLALPAAAAAPPEIAPSPAAAPVGTPVNRPKPVPSLPFKAPEPGPAAQPAGVDALSAAEVRKALSAIQDNYISGLSEEQKDRATLQGLLDRLGPSVSLSASGGQSANTVPFYSEAYQNRVGYLRPGDASDLDRSRNVLKQWSDKGIGAVILDLRNKLGGQEKIGAGPWGRPGSSDYQAAADLAGFFCGKGVPLFKLERLYPTGAAGSPIPFSSSAEPVFKGLLIVLIDSDTAEAAETAAAVLRASAKALLVGETSAGKAYQFSDIPLDGGLTLHVAGARARLPGGAVIKALKPDIAEPLGHADKVAIMKEIAAHGIGSVVAEQSRPHLNEVALVSGSDPDIDNMEAEQRRKEGKERPGPVIDRQLQRALDAATSISIFQARKDSGENDAPSGGE